MECVHRMINILHKICVLDPQEHLFSLCLTRTWPMHARLICNMQRTNTKINAQLNACQWYAKQHIEEITGKESNNLIPEMKLL